MKHKERKSVKAMPWALQITEQRQLLSLETYGKGSPIVDMGQCYMYMSFIAEGDKLRI